MFENRCSEAFSPPLGKVVVVLVLVVVVVVVVVGDIGPGLGCSDKTISVDDVSTAHDGCSVGNCSGFFDN